MCLEGGRSRAARTKVKVGRALRGSEEGRGKEREKGGKASKVSRAYGRSAEFEKKAAGDQSRSSPKRRSHRTEEQQQRRGKKKKKNKKRKEEERTGKGMCVYVCARVCVCV